MGIVGQSRWFRGWAWVGIFLLACAARGEEPAEALALIAKARAHLGAEEALDAIETLHFEGTVLFFESNSKARVRIWLSKPDCQRSEIETEDLLQVVAIEDMQGWELIVDKRAEPPTESLRFLQSPEYWKNHFSALENLWFHHGFEHGRGHLEWGGESVFEGSLVGRVTIDYGLGNRFVRRFDVRTGALVASTGNDGSDVRERDWAVIEGVRFPSVMEYYREGNRTSRMTFDLIEVNPTIDPALFRIPVY